MSDGADGASVCSAESHCRNGGAESNNGEKEKRRAARHPRCISCGARLGCWDDDKAPLCETCYGRAQCKG